MCLSEMQSSAEWLLSDECITDSYRPYVRKFLFFRHSYESLTSSGHLLQARFKRCINFQRHPVYRNRNKNIITYLYLTNVAFFVYVLQLCMQLRTLAGPSVAACFGKRTIFGYAAMHQRDVSSAISNASSTQAMLIFYKRLVKKPQPSEEGERSDRGDSLSDVVLQGVVQEASWWFPNFLRTSGQAKHGIGSDAIETRTEGPTFCRIVSEHDNAISGSVCLTSPH